jgi:hypothetical protein
MPKIEYAFNCKTNILHLTMMSHNNYSSLFVVKIILAMLPRLMYHTLWATLIPQWHFPYIHWLFVHKHYFEMFRHCSICYIEIHQSWDCVVFCRSLFYLLICFIWPLHCLPIDLPLLIVWLISANFSEFWLRRKNRIDSESFICTICIICSTLNPSPTSEMIPH